MSGASAESTRRVLITGVKGFTGRYVAAELQGHGWEVWGIGSQQPDDQSDARYRCVDLLDIDGLRAVVASVRPHAVVHLAAVAFVGHGDANDFYRVNLMGTRNLLSALAENAEDLKCVLLASSANVYGNTVGGVLSEATSPHPANDYAVSKLAMEWLANLWQERLPLVVARPFNYTGVGQATSFLLPKIVSHFRQRASVIELGNMDVWRDFSDVRDVAQAYRRLLQVRPLGQTLNVCSGTMHSLTEVIEMAESITGHRIERRVNPAFVRDNEVRQLCGDNTKLKAAIGDWHPRPLEETLRWMLEAEGQTS